MNEFMKFFERNKLTPRSQQIEVMDNLEENWDRYKYHVISAPVGVGKSYIALAIAAKARNSYLLTSTKQLQQQYMDTSNDPVNIKGKGNYPCGINRTIRADMAPCGVMPKMIGKCVSRGVCPYYRQKQKAMAAKVMLTNYSYFLYSVNCGPVGEADQTREVIICDEGHDLEKVLVSYAESTINPAELEKSWGIKNIAWRFCNTEQKNLDVLEDIYGEIQRKLNEYKAMLKQEYTKYGVSEEDANAIDKLPASAVDKIGKIGQKIYTLDKVMKPIQIFYEQKDQHKWIVSGNEEQNTLTLTPLHAAGIFDAYMGYLGEKFVFMSATIGDIDVFCKELGIPRDQVNFISVGTDFPAENSPIVFCPVCKMNYKEIDANMDNIVMAVAEIMKAHEGEKGIIHTGNYKIADALAKRLPSEHRKRLIHRDMNFKFKLKNQELVEMHTKDKRPTVLLSPSLDTGTDLYDDLSRWQIIVKCPFPSLGDPRTAVKSDLEPQWYLWVMMLSIMQASGRSTRHKEDHSITYVLDQSFGYFFGKVKTSAPSWFIERVHL